MRFLIPLILAVSVIACSDADTGAGPKGQSDRNGPSPKEQELLDRLAALELQVGEIRNATGEGGSAEARKRSPEELRGIIADSDGQPEAERARAVAELSRQVNPWVTIRGETGHVDFYERLLWDDPSNAVQKAAMIALHSVHHVRAAQALGKAFEHPDPAMRFYAAEGLGFLRMGAEKVTRELILKALGSSDEQLLRGACLSASVHPAGRGEFLPVILAILPNAVGKPVLLDLALISIQRLGGDQALQDILADESLDESIREKARARLPK